MNRPVIPAYGQSTLADVLPSVAAHLGVPHVRDVLDLPVARRYVVVLVDGLGQRLVLRHLREAPYLSDLLGDGVDLTCGVPSTTATSITSLGSGLPPGAHGIVGYTFREPASGVRMNALTWENGPADVEGFQSHETMFETMAAHGVACSIVVLPRFAGTGLTRAALRGADFVGVDDAAGDQTRADLVVAASAASERSVVYVYERRLDHVGHGRGVDSPAWRSTLTTIDTFLARLREQLPGDTVVLITGDHGMVDVPRSRRIVLEDVPGLLDDVDLIAGEGRFRQFVTGKPGEVAARFADLLGDRAWVHTREEAVALGWYGPTSGRVAPRIGDVLVAVRDDSALMSREFRQEFGLVGMHGSLTDDEMSIPLLIDAPSASGRRTARGWGIGG